MAETAPTQPKGRRAFVRHAVPPIERIISVGILLIIVSIGIAIWLKGRHFDPGLYSLRTDALASTAAEVTGKSGTAPPSGAAPPVTQAAATSVLDDYVGKTPMPSAAGPARSESLDVAGTEPMGATEFYSADNLYEKINGRAPAYIEFNFQELRCRSFAVAGAPGNFVDVYEYLMDTPVNAFGIFSLERDAKGKPLDFVADGYAVETGFFFRQGPRYVQIIASDQNPKTLALARTIAVSRAKALPVDDTGLEARRRLPATGMIASSIAYVKENAQGQSFLKDVFHATYDFEGKKIPFFVMVTAPDKAEAAWTSYRAFCARFGETKDLPDVEGARLFQSKHFGKCKAIYQRAGEMGGAYDAEDDATARAFVENYLRGKLR